MAIITSVYLSNRYLQACVGKPGAKKITVNTLCDTLLPEGCLINGVITNEGVLTAALKDFWAENRLPTTNVALVIESTQFLAKVFTLPSLPEKKLQTVVKRELDSVETRQETLADYMPLRHDNAAKTDTVLATSVEHSFIESHIALGKAAGLTLCCIDTAISAELKLTALLPNFAEKTCLLLNFDGDNLHAVLLENGQYKYSSRSRMFNTHGTPEFGAEVAQFLSGIVQFQAAGKSGLTISDAWFAGCSDADFAACSDGCTALGITPAILPESPEHITLPAGGDWHLADCVPAVGNLIGR